MFHDKDFDGAIFVLNNIPEENQTAKVRVDDYLTIQHDRALDDRASKLRNPFKSVSSTSEICSSTLFKLTRQLFK